MNRSSGMTLLELLLVLAIGSMLLAGISALLSMGIGTHRWANNETEARQALDYAMQEMGRAVRETQNVLVPTAGNLNRINANPLNNALAISLSPVLDANADGIPDVDNDRDGVSDWLVRHFDGSEYTRPYPFRADINTVLPDVSNDGAPGIVGVDDDGDGTTDDAVTEAGACSPTFLSNDETTCDAWSFTPNNVDWLDVMVFQVQANGGNNVLVQRQPTPRAANGSTFTRHVLARNVTTFTVRLNRAADAATGTRDRDWVEVRLCVGVLPDSRRSVCARRVWRVGGNV